MYSTKNYVLLYNKIIVFWLRNKTDHNQTNPPICGLLFLIMSDIYTSWEKSPFGTIFPNEPLGYADSRETIVASARRSPNSRLWRIPKWSEKLLSERRQSRAVIGGKFAKKRTITKIKN